MGSDSLTPYLGLIKPLVNDEAGEDLWGDKLNGNFDILDAFASSQGALVEAPTDGQIFGRQNLTWVPTIEKADYDNDQSAQNTVIQGKAPAGPGDGQLYGWKGTGWVVASGNVTVDWSQVNNKPSTFPPELPIPSSGVTGLDTKQAAQDAATTANTTALAGKEPIIVASDATKFWRGDKTWQPLSSITVDAYTKAQSDAKFEPVIATGNASYFWAGDKTWKSVPAVLVADTAPAGALDNSLWWDSDLGALFIRYHDPNSTQWVMVNAPGMPEASKDGKAYARKDGGWFDLTASFSAKADLSYVNTQLGTKADASALANYLPLAGGTLTGQLNGTLAQFTRNVASSYAIVAYNNQAGGAIYGDNAGTYGILGYTGGYSLYGNGHIYVSGGITAGGLINANASMFVYGTLSFPNISNFIMGYSGSANITTGTGVFQLMFGGNPQFQWDAATAFRSLQNGGHLLGASNTRWGQIYSSVSTISTSDENLKQDIRPLDDAEKRVAVALRSLVVLYRWKNRVEKEGDAARIHCGVIAQRVREAFAAEGLDANRYGLFCEDQNAVYVPPVVENDADGNPVQVAEGYDKPLEGTILSIRYEELLAFVIGGL